MRYQKADRVHPEAILKAGGFPHHPRPAPPAISDRPRRQRSSSSCSFCCCLSFCCSFFVIFVILALLAVLIFYILFQPQLPKYSLLDVAIKQLNVTNRAGGPISSLADVQNPVLNANIAFTILVENPNAKLGIHYKDVRASVSYEGSTFAHCLVVPFYQGRKSSSRVVADLQATSAPLSESQGKGLQVAIAQNDVPLFARINVGAGLEIGGWVTPSVHVQVACHLRVSPPTAPSGAKLLSKSCKWER